MQGFLLINTGCIFIYQEKRSKFASLLSLSVELINTFNINKEND